MDVRLASKNRQKQISKLEEWREKPTTVLDFTKKEPRDGTTTKSNRKNSRRETRFYYSTTESSSSVKVSYIANGKDHSPLLWGVRPWIPMADHMGCTPRGGLAHKTKPCEARLCLVPPTRHREDILKVL